MKPPATPRWFSRWLLPLLLLGCHCVASRLGAATYAVVAGVDDYPAAARLNSCTNDARAVRALLTDMLGVPPANVRLLLDGQATAAALESALRQQCKRAGRQDEVFFYFSGHGSIAPGTKAGEKAVKVLVTHGGVAAPPKESGYLTQDRLKRALADTRAARVIVVLDCCHAGTWTRSVSGTTDRQRVKFVDLGWGPAEGEFIKSPPDSFEEFRSKGASVHFTWLGACQADQVSYCGQQLSQFTDQLLARVRAAPRASLGVLFPEVAQRVEAATKANRWGAQTPQAEGALDLPLLAAAPAAPAGSSPAPPAPEPPRLTVTTVTTVTPPAERQDFPLTVALNQPRFIKDDRLVVTVTPARDCYLRLYHLSAALELQQIFPNQFQPENALKAGAAVRVPSVEAGFQFTMEGPWGVETIIAVASTEQFTDLVRPVYRDGHFDLGRETPGGALTRGLRIERRTESPVPAAAKPLISITQTRYTVAEQAP